MRGSVGVTTSNVFCGEGSGIGWRILQSLSWVLSQSLKNGSDITVLNIYIYFLKRYKVRDKIKTWQEISPNKNKQTFVVVFVAVFNRAKKQKHHQKRIYICYMFVVKVFEGLDHGILSYCICYFGLRRLLSHFYISVTTFKIFCSEGECIGWRILQSFARIFS
jgi:hypothetical protein